MALALDTPLFARMAPGTCLPAGGYGPGPCAITSKGLAALDARPLECTADRSVCALPLAAATRWCEPVSTACGRPAPSFLCSTPGGGVAVFSPGRPPPS